MKRNEIEYIMIKEKGNAPVTVAELVRCKDCAYLNRDPRFMNYGYCSYFKDKFYAKVNPDKNFYCGAGKRKL